MYWLACWNSNLEFSGLRPGSCHHVVSLDKKLNSSLSVSTKEYKWVPAGKGVASLPVACHRNWVKLGSCVTLPYLPVLLN